MKAASSKDNFFLKCLIENYHKTYILAMHSLTELSHYKYLIENKLKFSIDKLLLKSLSWLCCLMNDKRWIELQTINAIWYVVLSTKNLPYVDSQLLWIQLHQFFFCITFYSHERMQSILFYFAIIKLKHFIP